MKNKLVTGLLAIVMIAVFAGTLSSRVLAEPEAEVQEETAETEGEEESSEEDSDAVSDSESMDEEDSSAENESEETEGIPEEDADTLLPSETEEKTEEIQGMKVTLQNTLGSGLVSFEVKNIFMEAYSENLLNEEMIVADGEVFSLGIPEEIQDAELGMYDVRISCADGTSIEIPFVPFLENSSGILYMENGTALIQIRDERLEAEADPVTETEMIQLEAEISQAMAEALVSEIE